MVTFQQDEMRLLILSSFLFLFYRVMSDDYINYGGKDQNILNYFSKLEKEIEYLRESLEGDNLVNRETTDQNSGL